MYSTSLLKGLITAGSVSGLVARAIPGGFLLFARVGLDEAPVKAYRGQVRVFKKLDAVAKYVNEHPERWSEPAASLVIDAIRKAYPKKKKRK